MIWTYLLCGGLTVVGWEVGKWIGRPRRSPQAPPKEEIASRLMGDPEIRQLIAKAARAVAKDYIEEQAEQDKAAATLDIEADNAEVDRRAAEAELAEAELSPTTDWPKALNALKRLD